jgi:hypothetical protein
MVHRPLWSSIGRLDRSLSYLIKGTFQRGDDGTRTHDPLLANTPDLDNGGRWRTPLPDQTAFADGSERWRTVADVRQMFDRRRLSPRSARQGCDRSDNLPRPLRNKSKPVDEGLSPRYDARRARARVGFGVGASEPSLGLASQRPQEECEQIDYAVNAPAPSSPGPRVRGLCRPCAHRCRYSQTGSSALPRLDPMTRGSLSETCPTQTYFSNEWNRSAVCELSW